MRTEAELCTLFVQVPSVRPCRVCTRWVVARSFRPGSCVVLSTLAPSPYLQVQHRRTGSSLPARRVHCPAPRSESVTSVHCWLRVMGCQAVQRTCRWKLGEEPWMSPSLISSRLMKTFLPE